MKIVVNFAAMVGGAPVLKSIIPTVKQIASSMSPRQRVVEINLIGRKRITDLNVEYKDRRGAAEILTFNYLESEDSLRDGDDDATFGEIYIYYGKISRAADRLGVSRRVYLLRIIIHGLCHLKGYSHGDKKQAKKMEEVEKRLLRPVLKRDEFATLFS